MNKRANVVYILIIMGLVLPFALIGLLMAWLTGVSFLFPFIVVLYLSLGVILVTRFFKLKEHKKMLFRVTAVTIGLSLIYTVPGIYGKTRPVVGDGQVALYEYEPFGEDTKAVSLDEPSTFRIEDNLPIMDGATALYPVYSAFARAVYPEKDYFSYEGEVLSNRTGNAYENLIHGQVDMIFALAPSAAQLEKAKANNRELTLTPIGREAFVFFVNSKNTIDSLTVDEIKGIYSGEIKNWKDVGGRNNSIRAFQRPEDSGSQTALQHFMGDTPIMDPPVENIASLMGTILDEVANYRNYNNSIGYTFRYYSTEMRQSNQIKLLSINGIEPTKETIRLGDYPITNDIYAITAGSTNPHIDEFLEWILSEQGQEIVEKTGYVSLE